MFFGRPGAVSALSSPTHKVQFFRSLFASREDVFATRWENNRTGKAGWIPAVSGGWRNNPKKQYLPLTDDVVTAHLSGDIHIGLYPLLDDDYVPLARRGLRRSCSDAGRALLPEGRQGHRRYRRPWRSPDRESALMPGSSSPVTFPRKPPESWALDLLREAIAMRGRMDLSSYDRLFPSQDVLPASGSIGNLIAAPLQGRSRKDGATVFLDLGTLEPHDDQWAYLSGVDRLSPRDVGRLAGRLAAPRVGKSVDRLTRATATRTRPLPAAAVHVTLGAGVSIEMADLTPDALATLKHAASMPNPAFYDRQRRRFSTWGIPRFLMSYDETLDGRLVLPRGLSGIVTTILEQAGSRLDVRDRRVVGSPQQFTFTGRLRDDQAAAMEDLVPHSDGVLVAPPGAGKTVIALRIDRAERDINACPC